MIFEAKFTKCRILWYFWVRIWALKVPHPITTIILAYFVVVRTKLITINAMALINIFAGTLPAILIILSQIQLKLTRTFITVLLRIFTNQLLFDYFLFLFTKTSWWTTTLIIITPTSLYTTACANFVFIAFLNTAVRLIAFRTCKNNVCWVIMKIADKSFDWKPTTNLILRFGNSE